jgi:hypothetical protein
MAPRPAARAVARVALGHVLLKPLHLPRPALKAELNEDAREMVRHLPALHQGGDQRPVHHELRLAHQPTVDVVEEQRGAGGQVDELPLLRTQLHLSAERAHKLVAEGCVRPRPRPALVDRREPAEAHLGLGLLEPVPQARWRGPRHRTSIACRTPAMAPTSLGAYSSRLSEALIFHADFTLRSRSAAAAPSSFESVSDGDCRPEHPGRAPKKPVMATSPATPEVTTW